MGTPREADHTPDATGRILLNAGPSKAGAHRQELFRLCEQKFAFRYLIDGASAAVDLAPFGNTLETADRVEEAPMSASKDETQLSERPHLIIGSLVHIGTAHHYARLRQWQNHADPDLYYTPEEAIEKLAAENRGWHEHVGLSVDVTREMTEFWKRDAVTFRVLAVEEVIEVAVGKNDPRVIEECGPEGFAYTQRLDLAVEDAAGRVFIWDHKGVGHMRGGEANAFALSGQFLGYKTLGPLRWPGRFTSVSANMFERKSEKPKFKRVAPTIAPFALQCFVENLIQTELDIRRRMREGRDPWHWRKVLSEQGCRTIYGYCEHFDRCRRGPDAERVRGA